MTSPSWFRSPTDVYKDQLMRWYSRQQLQRSPGTTAMHMDAVSKCLKLGDVYRSVSDSDPDKRDAYFTASRMTQLTLYTLELSEIDKLEALYEWLQWWEEHVVTDPRPTRPQIPVLTLLERLHEIAKHPRGGFDLDPGWYFNGIDLIVADETSNTTYKASRVGRVNIRRGGEIDVPDVSNASIRGLVCDGTSRNKYIGHVYHDNGLKINRVAPQPATGGSRSNGPVHSQVLRQYLGY